MSHLVTVTGATGHVGKALAEQLLDRRINVRGIRRRAERLTSLVAKGAEERPADLNDTAFGRVQATFKRTRPTMPSGDTRLDERRGLDHAA